MARWKLAAPHYILLIPRTKYKYEETDRQTGERNEAVFDVPRLLDPDSPRDCRTFGECVVCIGPPTVKGDWQMDGDPTPDMVPLDEEAEKISTARKPFWGHPIETLPLQGGFSDMLLGNLEKQLTEAMRRATENAVPNQSLKGIDPEEFKKVQEQLAELMARNAELESKQPAPKIARRA